MEAVMAARTGSIQHPFVFEQAPRRATLRRDNRPVCHVAEKRIPRVIIRDAAPSALNRHAAQDDGGFADQAD